MSLAAAALGLGLIFIVMSDALRTTLGIQGGGAATRWIAGTVWAVTRRRESGVGSHRLRSVSGPLILLSTLVLWLVFLWVGWTLVFGAQSGAVVQGATGRSAGLLDRAYFTGYTLFTLGIGDMVPQGGFWQIATIVATVNGFFVATLSVAYVIPTLGAAVEKRRLAAWIANLGETPQEILSHAWDGRNFAGLGSQMAALVPAIEHHTQRHHAYPVVHYFHGAERRTSIGLSIAALDEAVAILLHVVPSGSRPPVSILRSLRRAIGGLIDTLDEGFVSSIAVDPPLPTVAMLEKRGVPMDLDGLAEIGADVDRRRRLLAFVRDGGDEWFEKT